jgi:riboflavin synthase
MFTGIVEEVGEIARVEPFGSGRSFRIAGARVLEGLRPGDSVAVDGVCLTATEVDGAGFAVEAVATTLERTTVGRFRQGTRVNLERAVAVGQRLGGHMVQGHVDGVGEVTAVERRGEHVLIDFGLPPLVADVTILHGSIALNGVSLTINALPAADRAQVSIIPHTWKVTTLSALEVGSAVNLEGDMIGKYVRHLLGRAAAKGEGGPVHLLKAWGYE